SFNGYLDELRIYNRALSQVEVTQLYNQGVGTHIGTTVNPPNLNSGLVAHYTFDGKDMIKNVSDTSGSGNTGFLNSFTSTTTQRGVIGQALSFNGVNNFVSSTNVVDVPTATVAAWVYVKATPAANSQIVGFENGNGNGIYDKDLYIGTDGKAYFYVYDG